MAVVISDPRLLEQLLARAVEVVEFRSPDGTLLGVFQPALGQLPPGARSPFTAAQRAAMRTERTGRPLADILRDLEARYGK